MRTISLSLSFSLLLAGCYSMAPVTKDEFAPDNRDAVFHLKDGSTIVSDWNKHSRVEGGYQVEGIRLKEGESQNAFTGVIADNDIDTIDAKEFNAGATIFSVLGAGFVAVVVGALVGPTMHIALR